MNHDISVEYKHVRIRPLKESDLEYLRRWRNDSQLNSFLRKIDEITPEMQKIWWINDCKDSEVATFAIEEIETLNRIVGSVSIYDIKDDTAEIGKIVVGDPDAKGKKIGYYALLMAMYAGYEKLGINKYLGEVHEDNKPAYVNDMRAGFIVTGKHPYIDGGYELDMVLPKEHFIETHDFISEFKIEGEIK